MNSTSTLNCSSVGDEVASSEPPVINPEFLTTTILSFRITFSMKKVYLKFLPFAQVEEALEHSKETGREQTYYNTCFHEIEEISAVVPEIKHIDQKQDRAFLLLEPWLHLILRSQGIQDADVHRLELPDQFVTALIHASAVGLYKGTVSDSDAEDLDVLFPSRTTRGYLLQDLFDAGHEFFVRLNTSSLKDSLDGGRGAVRSIRSLWTRLATSRRGIAGIKELRNAELPEPIILYLMPWDANKRTELEYRVFCPPPNGKIAAISQYEWHSPWAHFQQSRDIQMAKAWGIYRSTNDIHEQIMAHPSMTEDQKSRGFVFDVIEDPKVLYGLSLIELNEFGATTGCGACLFHWIRDGRVMYGMQEEVEFRVALPERSPRPRRIAVSSEASAYNNPA